VLQLPGAEVVEEAVGQIPFAAHGSTEICEDVDSRELSLDAGQLRVSPLVSRQSFPHGLEREVQHGNADQLRNQERLVGEGVSESEAELDVIQCFVGLSGAKPGQRPKPND
jgi:hypothetical protein